MPEDKKFTLKFDDQKLTVGIVDRWLSANRGNVDFSRACTVLSEITTEVPKAWGDPSDKKTFYNLHFRDYQEAAKQFSQFINDSTSKN